MSKILLFILLCFFPISAFSSEDLRRCLPLIQEKMFNGIPLATGFGNIDESIHLINQNILNRPHENENYHVKFASPSDEENNYASDFIYNFTLDIENKYHYYIEYSLNAMGELSVTVYYKILPNESGLILQDFLIDTDEEECPILDLGGIHFFHYEQINTDEIKTKKIYFNKHSKKEIIKSGIMPNSLNNVLCNGHQTLFNIYNPLLEHDNLHIECHLDHKYRFVFEKTVVGFDLFLNRNVNLKKFITYLNDRKLGTKYISLESNYKYFNRIHAVPKEKFEKLDILPESDYKYFHYPYLSIYTVPEKKFEIISKKNIGKTGKVAIFKNSYCDDNFATNNTLQYQISTTFPLIHNTSFYFKKIDYTGYSGGLHRYNVIGGSTINTLESLPLNSDVREEDRIYLQKTDNIDTEHLPYRIVTLSSDVEGMPEITRLDAVEIILGFVNSHLTYSLINLEEDLTTQEILEYGRGSCRHYAALFVAFARAHGIPARIVVGISYNYEDAEGHAWVEVNLNNKDWIPIEPQSHGFHPLPLNGYIPKHIIFSFFEEGNPLLQEKDYAANLSLQKKISFAEIRHCPQEEHCINTLR